MMIHEILLISWPRRGFEPHPKQEFPIRGHVLHSWHIIIHDFPNFFFCSISRQNNNRATQRQKNLKKGEQHFDRASDRERGRTERWAIQFDRNYQLIFFTTSQGDNAARRPPTGRSRHMKKYRKKSRLNFQFYCLSFWSPACCVPSSSILFLVVVEVNEW